MKKLIAIAAFIGLAATVNAQVALVSQYNKTIDTVVNTGVKYLYLPNALNGTYKTVDVAITYNKISGTLGGNVALEYSLESSPATYYRLQQDSVLTVTDGTTITKGWKLKDISIKNLRVAATGASTMSGQINAFVWPKN